MQASVAIAQKQQKEDQRKVAAAGKSERKKALCLQWLTQTKAGVECKLQKVGSSTLWTSSSVLVSEEFLTNSECLTSRAFTQREETGIAVNLSQLLCYPPPLLQK